MALFLWVIFTVQCSTKSRPKVLLLHGKEPAFFMNSQRWHPLPIYRSGEKNWQNILKHMTWKTFLSGVMQIKSILQFSQKVCILFIPKAALLKPGENFHTALAGTLWVEVFLGKTSKAKWYKNHALWSEPEPLATVLHWEFCITSITEQILNTRGAASKSDGREGWDKEWKPMDAKQVIIRLRWGSVGCGLQRKLCWKQ